MLFPGQACAASVPRHIRFMFHVLLGFSIYSHVWYRVTTLSQCCRRHNSGVPGMKMSPAAIVSAGLTMLTPLCCYCYHHRCFVVAFAVAVLVVSSLFGIIVAAVVTVAAIVAIAAVVAVVLVVAPVTVALAAFVVSLAVVTCPCLCCRLSN